MRKRGYTLALLSWGMLLILSACVLAHLDRDALARRQDAGTPECRLRHQTPWLVGGCGLFWVLAALLAAWRGPARVGWRAVAGGLLTATGMLAIAGAPQLLAPQMYGAVTAARPPLQTLLACSYAYAAVMLVLAIASLALTCWPHRRPARGHCGACGYNLTGNVSGRCPECGTSVPADGASVRGL